MYPTHDPRTILRRSLSTEHKVTPVPHVTCSNFSLTQCRIPYLFYTASPPSLGVNACLNIVWTSKCLLTLKAGRGPYREKKSGLESGRAGTGKRDVFAGCIRDGLRLLYCKPGQVHTEFRYKRWWIVSWIPSRAFHALLAKKLIEYVVWKWCSQCFLTIVLHNQFIVNATR